MVVAGLTGGGLERMVGDLSIALRDRGHAVAVFSVGGFGVHADRLREAGIPVHHCRDGRLRLRGVPLRLLRSIRRFRPHVIHAHSGTWLPASVTSLFVRSAALVYTEHGRYFPEPRLRAVLDRWCHRRTDTLVTVATDLADYLQGLIGLPEPPLVIRNGVDLAGFGGIGNEERTRLRDAWGAAPADTVGICVARYVPVKNHALLLDALAVCAAADVRLVLYGEGPLEGELRQRVAALHLDDRVRLCTFTPEIHVPLAAADFFVLSSTSEGLPMAVLEALASGLPVIATAVGGIADAVGNPPAGTLVESGDVAGLSQAIAKIATDARLRTELATRARERARAFSLEAMVDAYLAAYHAATANR